MSKRDLILAKLDAMNKTRNDKQSVIRVFENNYENWTHGNFFIVKQGTIECFEAWDDLNNYQTESIKKEFLIDDEVRIILERMKNDYLETKAEYAIYRLYEDNLSDKLIGRCLNEEEYECLLKTFMDWVFEEGKQLKEER